MFRSALAVAAAAALVISVHAQTPPAAPQAPADVEQDDPYGVSPMSKAGGATQVARAPALPPVASA